MAEERRDKKQLIRTIYLYAFSLLGLVLLIIGSVGFVNMGLKAYVFTGADQQRYIYEQPIAYPVANLEKAQDNKDLTDVDREDIRKIIDDYNSQKERNAKIDVVASQRQSDAAQNLSLIIVGLPLYIYHWRLVKREKSVDKR
ncbi:MAG TPA: hypothetical protein VJJ21_00875 [Candidatus Nanoarchaeia archaeon]|nr:hypothetical protein [Candidatus Nanoarchaeia archaeon]